MSGAIGLTSELLDLIDAGPGIEAGALFEASQLAEKRQQVYQALWQLKDSGRVEKKNKGYFLTSKGRSAAPKSKGLGWGDEESDTPARKSAEVHGDGKGAPLPPVPDPDRPGTLPQPTVRTFEPTGAVFAAFLEALLTVCKADSNAALRVLAEGVEEHKPENLQ